MNYTYDALSRLTQAVEPTGTYSFAYDNLGRLTQAVDATGTYSFTYDNLGRLTQTITNYSFLTSRTLTNKYSYDAASNRISFTDPESGVTSYTYDTLNRLTNSTATGSLTQNLNFAYDRYGNMTCTGGAGACSSLGYSATTNHITNSGVTYDAAGNLTADGTGTGTHTYQWDAEGRLSSVDGGPTASFTYDALGERAEMVEQGTRVEYPRGAAGEEMGLLNGGNGAWWHKYLPVGGAVRMHYTTDSGVDYTRFLHTNALGSVGMVTDGGGGVLGEELFYPWGQLWATAGYADLQRFAGLREVEPYGNGLYPARFRIQSSAQGRWLSPDPAGRKAVTFTDPQTWNMYAYVRNNPTTLIDPTGLDFNLACTTESGTCHNKQVGTWATDENNNRTFTATVVTSASLQDPSSGNTATVSEKGMLITTSQGTFQGIFINNTPAADVEGSGRLQDFRFHIDSSNEKKGALDAGTFTFQGTRDQTRSALDQRGPFRNTLDKRFLFGRSPDELVYHHDSTQHRFGVGPSPHFSVPDYPADVVPTIGPFHIDRDVGIQHAGCAWFGVGCE